MTAPVLVAAWWWLFVPVDAKGARRRARTLVPGLFLTWAVLAFLVAGERRGPSVSVGWAIVVGVSARAGRGHCPLPAAGLRPLAAGVPLRLAPRHDAGRGRVASRAARRARRADRGWRGAAPSGELPWRLVLPGPRALFKRSPYRHGGRRRASHVPAAGCRHRGGGDWRVPAWPPMDAFAESRHGRRRRSRWPPASACSRLRRAIETASTGARRACGETRSRSDRTTRGRESRTARLWPTPAAWPTPRSSSGRRSRSRRTTRPRGCGWARFWRSSAASTRPSRISSAPSR